MVIKEYLLWYVWLLLHGSNKFVARQNTAYVNSDKEVCLFQQIQCRENMKMSLYILQLTQPAFSSTCILLLHLNASPQN